VKTGAITGGAHRLNERLTVLRLPRASTASTRSVWRPARMLFAGTDTLNRLLFVLRSVRPSTDTTTRLSLEASRTRMFAVNAAREQPEACTPPTEILGFVRSTRAAGAAEITVA